MAAKEKQVWAIGFHGYVEIRACTQAPKAVCTEYEREVTRRIGTVYESRSGMLKLRYSKAPFKLSLKHIIHTGGKVLTSMGAVSFQRKTGLAIPAGGIFKLTKTQAAKVLKQT